MTILAAVYNGPTDYVMAADSALTDPSGLQMQARKIWHAPGAMVGFAGADPIAQRWRRMLGLPSGPGYALVAALQENASRRAVEEALVALHDAVIGFAGSTPPDAYPRTGSGLLVLWAGGIASLDQFGCVHFHDRWWCEGSGREVGLGYLRACADHGSGSAEDRAIGAVGAACDLLSGCRGPTFVVTQDTAGVR